MNSENDVAKSSFNIFAVRRAFAYGHSLLAAKVCNGSNEYAISCSERHCIRNFVFGSQERTHESENTSTGGTALGALISFTRPNETGNGQSQSTEADDEPERKRARN